MKTIMLYGFLGKKYGKVHRYEVGTPAEAIRALCATLQGFKKSVIDGGFYRLVVDGSDLDVDQLANPTSERETVRLVPVIEGANGFGKVVLGAALIAGAIYMPALAGVAIGSTTVGAIATSVGFALVLGGVSEMLFSAPDAPDSQERPESKPSFIFNGAVNTSRQGNAVPVCYGRTIVGSQVISAGLSVDQIL